MVTVKVKVKGRQEKKVYRYVRVVGRAYSLERDRFNEKVIATLGTLSDVSFYQDVLIRGLKNLPGQ